MYFSLPADGFSGSMHLVPLPQGTDHFASDLDLSPARSSTDVVKPAEL
jgi:hypothetical protein